jgi:exopolysaccharide biosynthesis protein
MRPNQTYRARIREVKDSANTQIQEGTMILSVGPQTGLTNAATAEAILEFSTTLSPNLSGVKVAIAGGPILIKDGKPFSLTAPPAGARGGYSEGSKYERHPRSAVGWNATHVYLLTVDGRQPGLSVGMTLAELADYMVKLGCTDGMNFDGGASASMWMSGKIISNPCQGERPVANSLFVVRKGEGAAKETSTAAK